MRRSHSVGDALQDLSSSSQQGKENGKDDAVKSPLPTEKIEKIRSQWEGKRLLSHASQLDGFWDVHFDPDRMVSPASSGLGSAGFGEGIPQDWGPGDHHSDHHLGADDDSCGFGVDFKHTTFSQDNAADAEFVFDMNLFPSLPSVSTGLSLEGMIQRASLEKAVRNANARIREVRSSTSAKPRQVAREIQKRRSKLERLTSAPAFLRTSDKIVFTVFVVIMLVTEGVLLHAPERMTDLYVGEFFVHSTPFLAFLFAFY
jgi:hypothetical protein